MKVKKKYLLQAFKDVDYNVLTTVLPIAADTKEDYTIDELTQKIRRDVHFCFKVVAKIIWDRAMELQDQDELNVVYSRNN